MATEHAVTKGETHTQFREKVEEFSLTSAVSDGKFVLVSKLHSWLVSKAGDSQKSWLECILLEAKPRWRDKPDLRRRVGEIQERLSPAVEGCCLRVFCILTHLGLTKLVTEFIEEFPDTKLPLDDTSNGRLKRFFDLNDAIKNKDSTMQLVKNFGNVQCRILSPDFRPIHAIPFQRARDHPHYLQGTSQSKRVQRQR
jgi:hypothetical protein